MLSPRACRSRCTPKSLKKFDQELAYLNTADYEKHAAQQIEEAKKLSRIWA